MARHSLVRMDPTVFQFEQIHIDVARNSTDDFNPFHDPHRWRNIRDNPFGAPIVLGFQLEFLVDFLVTRHREETGEARLVDERRLRFSNHELVFAGVLRSGEPFHVDVRKTLAQTTSGGGLTNRVMVRKEDGDIVLVGTQSDTAEPRFLADTALGDLGVLDRAQDRTWVGNGRFFLKRKFVNTSNVKNFALAALTDQHYYVDELAERVSVPPMFTASLLSCALLEEARLEGYDFEANPLVYTSHQISIDRSLQRTLRSNDRLHLLVTGAVPAAAKKGLGHSAVAQSAYNCFGVVAANAVLFRASVQTAPLQAILARS
ncbi:MAG: hypothetical protein WCA32_20260 [Chromatiaceae bacterium]